jgi:limonene-1,2-epoxide hydrolase
VIKMSDSPESVVRKFLAAWADPKLDELVGFFSDDAVFIDGPRGVYRGIDAIRAELKDEISMGFGGTKIDVDSLVANDGTVMMEGVENYRIGGEHLFLEVMGAFAIGADGRITRWRYSYDLKSITDQLEAAGLPVPESELSSHSA